MKCEIVYETYNNKDMKNTVFCDNKETATDIASGLSILKHITNIMIEEVEDCKE
jgi:hypothetical protein